MTEGKLTLGQYFKLEREKRGITLEIIEKQTKISKQTLQFLEDDRLDVLPPRAFLRGFLQCIAKDFDMDGEELIRQLDEALNDYDKAKTLGQQRIGRRKGRLIYFIIIIIIAAVIAVGLSLCINRSADTGKQSSLQPLIAHQHDPRASGMTIS
ncbi:MAG: helix-turn-helix domain-containing protein [Syntrophaceae bacterium]